MSIWGCWGRQGAHSLSGFGGNTKWEQFGWSEREPGEDDGCLHKAGSSSGCQSTGLCSVSLWFRHCAHLVLGHYTWSPALRGTVEERWVLSVTQSYADVLGPVLPVSSCWRQWVRGEETAEYTHNVWHVGQMTAMSEWSWIPVFLMNFTLSLLVTMSLARLCNGRQS